MRQKHLTDEQIIKGFNSMSKPKFKSRLAVYLGISINTVVRRCKTLDLKFDKNDNIANLVAHRQKVQIPLSEILEGKHPSYQTLKLKKRLISSNILVYECSECGIIDWNGNPIALQLDHIDGNPHNHVLSNLRLICPNCHSQTDTYCGRNKQSG